MITDVKLLDSSQTETFDTEYVGPELFASVKRAINQYVKKERFSFADVGGGNGVYSDRILKTFVQAKAVVIEPDEYLASKNRHNARKQVIRQTYQQVAENYPHQFDVVSFNWVLHHFVGESYQETLRLQTEGLKAAKRMLKPGGVLLIFENFYDGKVKDDIPSRLIYELTASTWLKHITKSMGANTAGVGVCFHSEHAWQRMLSEAGLTTLVNQDCYDFGNLNAIKKALLAIKRQRVGFIVAA